MSTLVTGVDFAMLPTTDYERAKTFYGETLGLPLSTEYGRVPGAEYETGNLTLVVFDFSAVGQKVSATGGPIALRVDDVAAARAELESRGVEFLHDTIDSGVCHQAIFRDPDGNTLILHHRYAPRDT
jgi:catechol 2,3-dioxygenase-like lactoylglutathione lyase family enzyme